ncbi:hypothetical protein [Streptomyces sp. NPDC048560]|uniref:tetratricopeptide repeat protein n=1 Tax=Streptomyces sp. NPDC048560 TaxID=3155488 RepID=UPI003432F8EA
MTWPSSRTVWPAPRGAHDREGCLPPHTPATCTDIAAFGLVTVPSPGGVLAVPDIHRLSDYLDHHARTIRFHTFPPDSFWAAARDHAAGTSDLEALAEAADRRGRYRIAADLYQRSAAAGGTGALAELAWRRGRAGNLDGAEHLYQRAIDAGDTGALAQLAQLRGRTGDLDGAEPLAQRAADAGDTGPLVELAWRRGEAGDLDGAERLAQRAADAGNINAWCGSHGGARRLGISTAHNDSPDAPPTSAAGMPSYGWRGHASGPETPTARNGGGDSGWRLTARQLSRGNCTPVPG